MKTHAMGMTGTLMFVAATALAGCRERAPAGELVQPEPLPVSPVTPVPATTAPSTPAPPPAPPRAPAVEPSRVRVNADAKLSVRRLVIARGVKNREPVDPGTSFKGTNGDPHKVYAFVELENRGGEPAEIVVEFEPPGGGAPHGDVTLAVGAAPRWRTWAYTRTATTPGTWTAVVKSRKGDVLARAPFEITL